MILGVNADQGMPSAQATRERGAAAAADVRLPRGYAQDKQAYLRRLKRIEGQVRGLQRMVDEDEYCIDVLTQVSAVTSALQSLSLGLLEDHLGHCVVHAARQGDAEAEAKVREATAAIARLVK